MTACECECECVCASLSFFVLDSCFLSFLMAEEDLLLLLDLSFFSFFSFFCFFSGVPSAVEPGGAAVAGAGAEVEVAAGGAADAGALFLSSLPSVMPRAGAGAGVGAGTGAGVGDEGAAFFASGCFFAAASVSCLSFLLRCSEESASSLSPTLLSSSSASSSSYYYDQYKINHQSYNYAINHT